MSANRPGCGVIRLDPAATPRGYVTIGLVAQCRLLFPSDPDYDDEPASADVLAGVLSYIGLGGSYDLKAALRCRSP